MSNQGSSCPLTHAPPRILRDGDKSRGGTPEDASCAPQATFVACGDTQSATSSAFGWAQQPAAGWSSRCWAERAERLSGGRTQSPSQPPVECRRDGLGGSSRISIAANVNKGPPSRAMGLGPSRLRARRGREGAPSRWPLRCHSPTPWLGGLRCIEHGCCRASQLSRKGHSDAHDAQPARHTLRSATAVRAR